MINDIDERSLDETAEAVRARGGQVVAIAGDAATREQNDRLVAAAVEHYGQLDCIDLVTGGAQPKPMLETSDDEYRRILALNLDSA